MILSLLWVVLKAFFFWFAYSNVILLLQAACGLAQKPKKVQVVDIDAKDANNDLAGVEYVEDIYKFYKLVEVYFYCSVFIFSGM